jgi:hydroxylamine dehydrogenase
MIDKGTSSGVGLVEEARAIMTRLHQDKLLLGQTSNRPAPPRPDKDEPGGFFGLFWSKGNNPTRIDVEFAEMWEQHLMRHFKGLAHVNPGGFTYTDGWSKLIRSLARIRDEDTRLRERAALEARVQALEGRQGTRQGLLDGLDRPTRQASLGIGMAGAGLLMLGVPAVLRRRRSGR